MILRLEVVPTMLASTTCVEQPTVEQPLIKNHYHRNPNETICYFFLLMLYSQLNRYG